MEQITQAPDVIYIGYAKTAATFLNRFFEAHPETYVDRLAKRYANRPEAVTATDGDAAAAGRDRVYVSFNEKVSEARVMAPNIAWKELRFDATQADRLDDMLEISPRSFADTYKRRFPDCKILMCIRDQADWLSSNYRYYIEHLHPKRRSFHDFCRTPMGEVLLRVGLYDLTIGAYLDAFGPDRVHVLRFEILKTDRETFLRELCAFVGIDPITYEAPPANVGRSALTTKLHTKAHLAGKLPAPLHRLADSAAAALGQAVGGNAVLSPAERAFINSFYAVSNQRTRKLMAQLAAAKTPAAWARQTGRS